MSNDASELLAALAAEGAGAREQEHERDRRSRVVRAMSDRLALLDGERAKAPSRGNLSRWWLLLPAAAAVALAVGAAQRSAQPSTLELQPERLRPVQHPEAPEVAPPRAPQQPALQRPSIASALRPSPSSPLKGAPLAPSSSAEPTPVDPSLAAQNELFQSAVRASRRGDDSTALAELDALLTRYPGSVLAADARVRKFRTLSRLGRADEAKAAAADYLAKHPEGFAAAEASKVVTPAAPIAP